MTDIRALTEARIADVLKSELPLHPERLEEVARAVVRGLDALLEEQEGFVPDEFSPPGGNPIPVSEVSVSIPAAKVVAGTSKVPCVNCNGKGHFTTESMFGGKPHLDTCETCHGRGEL